MIERCNSAAHPGWLSLREDLWPQNRERHLEEMSRACEHPSQFATFVAYDDLRNPVGFIEVSIRTDYVNGTNSSPVAFLEGMYVGPGARRMGIARALVAEVLGRRRRLHRVRIGCRAGRFSQPRSTPCARIRRNRACRLFQAFTCVNKTSELRR